MRRTLLHLAATLIFGTCSTAALATCAPPAKPGAVICFPTSNSTVTFPMTIEGAATGEGGLPITKMILYSNEKNISQFNNTDTFSVIDQGDVLNQSYHLVLNAWDSEGHLFQASSTVKEIDGDYNCSHPASGINFCSPPNGSYQPNNFLQLQAWASSNVTSMNTWQNGKLILSSSGDIAAGNFGSSTASPSWQSFTVRAYKGSEFLYSATAQYKLYYAYQGTGPDNPPGLQIQQPTNYEDVNSPFAVQAQVVQNPKPITEMKVYLDSTVVGTSTGATVVTKVTASSGTHLLTVEAWDTTGTLYKTQQTVNVY